MSETQSELDLIIDRNALNQPVERIIEELEEATTKLVVVRLAETLYAFPGRQVREILPCSQVFLVPGCPGFVEGIMNIRGDIDSVLNLHRVLKIPDAPVSASSRILVGLGAGIRSCLRVDAVEDVLDVPESSIIPPFLTLPEEVRGFAGGQLSLEGGTVLLLNLDLLFGKFLS